MIMARPPQTPMPAAGGNSFLRRRESRPGQTGHQTTRHVFVKICPRMQQAGASYQLEMKPCGTWMVLLACAASGASAQLAVMPGPTPQGVFGGQSQEIRVCWRNAGDHLTEIMVQANLLQASSATVVSISTVPWKILQVLPDQTVLESASLDFPSVRAETRFLIQWLADSNRVMGTTEVLVYPTNLLSGLKPLLNGNEKLGVLDPNDAVKPALKQNGVDFVDLADMALEDFSSRLAIIGPFQSKMQVRDGLAQAIQRIARKGTAVVWIQPPPNPSDEITPSFYIVPVGKGTIVVVQPDLVADFRENPRSQLNLIHFCNLALHPVPLSLPDLSLQP